jgi:hypothetical protein
MSLKSVLQDLPLPRVTDKEANAQGFKELTQMTVKRVPKNVLAVVTGLWVPLELCVGFDILVNIPFGHIYKAETSDLSSARNAACDNIPNATMPWLIFTLL